MSADTFQRPYKLRGYEDLINLRAPEFLIEGLIMDNSLAMIVGASGSYKSTLAIDIAVCLQHNIPWQNRATRQCNVALFNHEDGGGFRARYLSALTHYGVSTKEVYWDWTVPNLFDKAQVNACIAEMKAKKIKVVIVDTFAHAIPGAEENSSRDMGIALSSLRSIQTELGATVLVVHHTGKDSTRGARGSSALNAAIDTELSVKASRDEVLIRATKQRHSSLGMPITLKPIKVDIESSSACVLISAGGLLAANGKPVSSSLTNTACKVLRGLADQHNSVPLSKCETALFTNDDFTAGQSSRDSSKRAMRRCMSELDELGLISIEGEVIEVLASGEDTTE